MRRSSILVLAVGLVVLTPIPPAAADDFDGAALYDKCVKSTVFIVVSQKDGNVLGSGSLIDVEKKLVITCAHIVGQTDSVFCQFPIRNKDGTVMSEKKKYMDRVAAGQALKGKVLHRDRTRDLALVELDKLPTDTPALPMAKVSPRPGEKTISILNPEKVDSTFGSVTGDVRAVDVREFIVGGSDGTWRIKAKMVTTTYAIGPGDSGGPVIDKRGYLVAVMESGIFVGRTQYVNGAIDVTEVRAFLTEKKIKLTELAGDKDR